MKSVMQELRRNAGTDHLLAPYVHCPRQVVDAWCDFLGLGPEDVVVEIGFGDGRLMRGLAERAGCRVVGFEVDEEALADAEALLGEMEEEARDRVRCYGKDAMAATPEECDWPAVAHCYGYLTKAGLRQVYPQLKERMRPGAAFYCIQFSIDGEEPVETQTFDFVDDKGAPTTFTFFKYTIPGAGAA